MNSLSGPANVCGNWARAMPEQLDPHPGHAIRVLSELCAVRPDKPIPFNEVMVDFGLSLLDRDDAWEPQVFAV